MRWTRRYCRKYREPRRSLCVAENGPSAREHRLPALESCPPKDQNSVSDLRLLLFGSKQGHAEATFYLAQAYRSGSPEMGLSKDLRLFGELVQQAAAAGSADALFALGGAFFHGEDGFAPDPRAAFRCAAGAIALSWKSGSRLFNQASGRLRHISS